MSMRMRISGLGCAGRLVAGPLVGPLVGGVVRNLGVVKGGGIIANCQLPMSCFLSPCCS
jgi:hypothetical protein